MHWQLAERNVGMSNRERWVVYPLLFLAISLSIKTQLSQARLVDTDIVQCRRLIVSSSEKQPRVELIGGEHSGVLALMDERGVDRVLLRLEESTGEGHLDFGGPDRTTRATLRGTPRGGLLSLIDSGGQLEIMAGYPEEAGEGGIVARRHGQRVPDQSGDSSWGIQLPAADSTDSNQAPDATDP
jgi:hypothetical protein